MDYSPPTLFFFFFFSDTCTFKIALMSVEWGLRVSLDLYFLFKKNREKSEESLSV